MFSKPKYKRQIQSTNILNPNIKMLNLSFGPKS